MSRFFSILFLRFHIIKIYCNNIYTILLHAVEIQCLNNNVSMRIFETLKSNSLRLGTPFSDAVFKAHIVGYSFVMDYDATSFHDSPRPFRW